MTSINVLLVGPQNSGKSTLFNALTGLQSKIVNYPGSTVDFCVGLWLKNNKYTIIDTPGILSLTASSDDERITLESLTHLDKLIPSENSLPSIVISVVDMSQASRHFVLTQQLIEKGYPVITVLTMADLVDKKKLSWDAKLLEEQLSCPVIQINAKRKEGLEPLEKTLAAYTTSPYKISKSPLQPIQSYYEKSEVLLKTIKYAVGKSTSFDLDSIILHPVYGGVIFLSVMALFFYGIFSCAAPLMDFIDFVFSALNEWVLAFLPSSWITRLASEGIITGLASMLVFVPQIAILFLGIGLLESTGYLARGAVLVDRPLSFFGLNGRCFVPLLSGYACAIPALMATRSIQQTKTRLLCCFIIPLMQCSARLPVYGLLLALLFGDDHMKSAGVLTAIYMGSIALGAIVSVIVSRYLPGEANTSFNLELPSWKWPHFTGIIVQAWKQTRSYIYNAGPMIVAISIVLWVLSTFPSEESSFAMWIGQWIEPVFKPMGLDWRVGVAILLSFAAREVFVSVLLVLFTVGHQSENMMSVLQQATFQGTNTPIFDTASITGLIIFFMIALQCGTTVVVAKKEMKSTSLALTQLGVYIGGAYLLSVIVVQLMRLFS